MCDVINALFHPHFSGAQKHAFMTSLMDCCLYDVINGLFFPIFFRFIRRLGFATKHTGVSATLIHNSGGDWENFTWYVISLYIVYVSGI